MTNTRAKIEFGLNIAIAVAIVLIAGVVVKRAFFPEQVNPPALEAKAQMLVGTRIDVPGVSWAQKKDSGLLSQEGLHFLQYHRTCLSGVN